VVPGTLESRLRHTSTGSCSRSACACGSSRVRRVRSTSTCRDNPVPAWPARPEDGDAAGGLQPGRQVGQCPLDDAVGYLEVPDLAGNVVTVGAEVEQPVPAQRRQDDL